LSDMSFKSVNFSIASHAAWAPGIETQEAWQAWAQSNFVISGESEPAVRAMPSMLRRRAGFLGKMALEVAYQCLGERTAVPTIFCSRHGEVSRSVDMLTDLANEVPLSPTSFGLSVHNAIGGLFSIARKDNASNIALAAGKSSIEHAVIEACGLLADGESSVLLVVYDCPLPTLYSDFEDESEQPHAWAWLMQAPGESAISLSWSSSEVMPSDADRMPAGLEILRFHLRKDRELCRTCDGRQWNWMHHV
jgi:beta-ketoacyl synthase-like protein